MRDQRWIVVCLFIVFTGSLAQKYGNNVGKEHDDEDSPPNDNAQPPSNNINNRNSGSDNGNQVRVPTATRSSGSNTPAKLTQLASDEDCRLDVQKYCAKGSKQSLSNLKVLQCIDDLDNVSCCFSLRVNDVHKYFL